MSVIARKRNESRFEPIYKALQIREELTLLRNRNFGIDITRFARSQYQNGNIETANPAKYILYVAEIAKQQLEDLYPNQIDTYVKTVLSIIMADIWMIFTL